MTSFVSRRSVLVLLIVLTAQIVASLALLRNEELPAASPLSDFPEVIGDWRLLQEGVVEQETLDVLRADDVITRIYGNRQGMAASLFAAYFKTQRTGQAPHSPKNCLPGSGWVPTVSDIRHFTAADGREVELNRYVVEKGSRRSVVLYWYQSRDRTVASEYWAKIYLVLDALRHNRSDTAILRVTMPLREGDEDLDSATAAAMSLVESVLTALDQFPQFKPA